MKLKYLFIVVFLFVSTIPLVLGLEYLNRYVSVQYREQVEDKLSALSAIAKERIQAVVSRVEDSTALISSRTQLRISLNQWNQTRKPENLDLIKRIINDARILVPRLHWMPSLGTGTE